MRSQMVCLTISLWPRNCPVRRSSFHNTPAFPALNDTFCVPTSTSTRSNTSSRSNDSPGACWKYHASFPVSAFNASVELEYSVLSNGRRPAIEKRPRLRLRGSPVREIQIGIVRARDPRFDAGALLLRQLAPRVEARLTFARNRVEPPRALSCVDIDGADVTPIGRRVPTAAGDALQHVVANHDGAAGGWMIHIGERRVPQDVAGARAERDHVRVARRQKDFVLGDGDAADAAIPGRLIGTHARFPDEVAGFRIDRLHDVAGAREIHHAVVDDGRRLIRTRVVHRPDPCELQILHVVARDLIERAVAPPVIVAAEDEPVARRRILQHLRRHRDVVLHLASDGDTAHRGGAAATLSAAGAGAKRHRRWTASAARGSRIHGHRRLDREVLRSRPASRPLDHVRDDIERHLFAERSRRLRRHRFHDVAEELVDRPPTPRAGEVGAGERRRVARSRQIGAMATGAADLVGGPPGIGLPLRVGASWLLLCCRDGDDNRHEKGNG